MLGLIAIAIAIRITAIISNIISSRSSGGTVGCSDCYTDTTVHIVVRVLCDHLLVVLEVIRLLFGR